MTVLSFKYKKSFIQNQAFCNIYMRAVKKSRGGVNKKLYPAEFSLCRQVFFLTLHPLLFLVFVMKDWGQASLTCDLYPEGQKQGFGVA